MYVVENTGSISSIKVKIEESMGYVSDNESNYMPQLFNSGYIENDDTKLDFIVLGPPQKKSKLVPVQVLGSVKITRNKQVHNYILSQTIKPQVLLDVHTFDDFATKYYSIKSILSLYLNNQYGMGEIEHIEWRNETSALRSIDLLLKNE